MEQCINCANHSGTIERLNALEREVDCIGDVRERVTTVENSSKSAHHRIDAFDKHIEAIILMSSSVTRLAEEVEKSNKLIKEIDIKHDTVIQKLDTRMTNIEQKPSILALKLWIYLGGIIATGVLGILVGKVIK